jgi:hypothetical protein
MITAQKKRFLLTFGRFGPKVSRAGGAKGFVDSLSQPMAASHLVFISYSEMKREDA